jgi:type I site-specific restriction-modification system R (restriction) subunit
VTEIHAADKAWLVDFSRLELNDFLVVNQFSVKCGNSTRRPDVVVFLNGLPLVVIELKDPTDEQAIFGRRIGNFRIISSTFRPCSPTTNSW